jgi:DNA-binding NarL/FixJ family response regulator
MVSESVFTAAWTDGRRLDREEAITEALTDPGPSQKADPAMAQPPGVNGLTTRESEVLRLLVDGKTDRQIGEDLFLSRRTVTSHVSAILGKLGVETRTAAASVALRRGLV